MPNYPWQDPRWAQVPEQERHILFNEVAKRDPRYAPLPVDEKMAIRTAAIGAISPPRPATPEEQGITGPPTNIGTILNPVTAAKTIAATLGPAAIAGLGTLEPRLAEPPPVQEPAPIESPQPGGPAWQVPRPELAPSQATMGIEQPYAAKLAKMGIDALTGLPFTIARGLTGGPLNVPAQKLIAAAQQATTPIAERALELYAHAPKGALTETGQPVSAFDVESPLQFNPAKAALEFAVGAAPYTAMPMAGLSAGASTALFSMMSGIDPAGQGDALGAVRAVASTAAGLGLLHGGHVTLRALKSGARGIVKASDLSEVMGRRFLKLEPKDQAFLMDWAMATPLQRAEATMRPGEQPAPAVRPGEGPSVQETVAADQARQSAERATREAAVEEKLAEQRLAEFRAANAPPEPQPLVGVSKEAELRANKIIKRNRAVQVRYETYLKLRDKGWNRERAAGAAFGEKWEAQLAEMEPVNAETVRLNPRRLDVGGGARGGGEGTGSQNLQFQTQEPPNVPGAPGGRPPEVAAEPPQAGQPQETPAQVVGEIPPHIARAVAEPKQVSLQTAIATKQQAKETLRAAYKSGEVASNAPIRLTTVEELNKIVENGALTEGVSFEGQPGLSAQIAGPDRPILAYGANDRISAAIIFPKEAALGRGKAPNEVLIDPRTDLSRVRFIVDGYDRLLTFEQLVEIVRGGKATAPEVAATATPPILPTVEKAGERIPPTNDAGKLFEILSEGEIPKHLTHFNTDEGLVYPPPVLYRGGSPNLSVESLGITTKHGSSALGFFFSPDKATAGNYAKHGAPVMSASVDISRAYPLSQAEYTGLETPAKARAFRERLIAQGYNGIYYPYADEWIAFSPEQVYWREGITPRAPQSVVPPPEVPTVSPPAAPPAKAAPRPTLRRQVPAGATEKLLAEMWATGVKMPERGKTMWEELAGYRDRGGGIPPKMRRTSKGTNGQNYDLWLRRAAELGVLPEGADVSELVKLARTKMSDAKAQDAQLTGERPDLTPAEQAEFDREAARPGPGTKTAAAGREHPTDIIQLAESLGRGPGRGSVGVGEVVRGKIRNAADRAKQAASNLKAISEGLWDAYVKEPTGINADRAAEKWQGGLQRTSWETRQFAKAVKEAHPDKLRRQAMAVYAEADGDLTKLKTWAEGSSRENRRKYEAAQTLTPEEQHFARNARLYWDAKLDQAIEAGLLEQGLDDYVMHLVGRQNKFLHRVRAEVDLGKLGTRPSFTKQRIHDTIFDAERAGNRVNSDLGAMLSAYEQSFGKALANRAYIRALTTVKASDGRPIAVPSPQAGVVVSPEGKKPAVLLRQIVPPERVGDYRVVNHPALRGWTWAGEDTAGNPIIYRSDLLIHPEAYAKLKNRLAASWFRTAAVNIGGVEVKPFVGLMRFGQTIKGTMLDLSGFHQVQTALHGMEHRVNPFRLTDINLDDPKQMGLVEGGLQIADYRAMQEFSEGATSGSLVRKIPVLGVFAQKYNEYLFHDFIPKLKMTMGLHALERNRGRYPKMSAEDLNALTARQANGAFGELNYRLMGRNPTFQDLLRLTLLAPDFLEARGRFVAQAFKPFGGEQATALMLGAVGMYALARVANYVINDDHNMHWERPFSLIHNGKEYRLRTVQGDLVHLLQDPRGFAWVRANPATMRPAVEILTGRDEYGNEVAPGQRMIDIAKQSVPIVFQKKLRSPDNYSWFDSALQAMGVSNVRYQTPAEKQATIFASEKSAGKTTEERTKSRKEGRIISALRRGEEPEIPKEFGKGTVEFMRRTAKTDSFVSHFMGLEETQAEKVWNKASEEEKTKLRPTFSRKIENAIRNSRDPEERARLKGLRQAIRAER